MSWVEGLKNQLPLYAKDARLNLEAVLTKSSLDANVAAGCAYASALALADSVLTEYLDHSLDPAIKEPAHAAAITMAQNNVWYPFAEMARKALQGDNNPRLRMNAVVTYKGAAFEAYSLAASIIGKCHFCIEAHIKSLEAERWSIDQIRDVGRIAATMNAVSKGLRFS